MSEKEQVQDKIVNWMDSLEKAVTEYSPDIMNAGLSVIQIEGVRTLLTAFFFLAVIGTIAFSGWKTYTRTEPDEEERRSPFKNHPATKIWGITIVDNDGDLTVGVMAPALVSFFGIIGAIAVLETLLNLWNWVMVFEPKLYVAKQATEKIIGL